MQKRPFRDAENHSERPNFTTRADFEELLDKTCRWVQRAAGFERDAGGRLGIPVARENNYSVVTAKSSGTRVYGAAKQRGPLGGRLLARMFLVVFGGRG